MKINSKAFCLGLLGALAGGLALCAALVWWVDPCFQFRFPPRYEPVFFNERYQNAGMAKHIAADTLIMGTSMVANYRPSMVEEAFGGTALKLTFPDGYLSEFDQALDVTFRHGNPKRVIFGLDTNVMVRSESNLTGAMPDYLYNASPFDDVKYLLNKDSVYYSLYALRRNAQGTADSVDAAYTWNVWWAKETALAGYIRPEVAPATVAADAYVQDTQDNVTVITDWARAHPETQFTVFFPPYSILYWDKAQRQGATDAVFAALDAAMGQLLPEPNIQVYFFPADLDIITNLDYYGDYIHHSEAVCGLLLEDMAAGEGQMTAENYTQVLAQLRDFVVHYDYESIWPQE